MRGVNKAILVGTLGKDPEVRYTGDGTAVCSVSVATSESWKDKATGKMQEQTEWHRVVFYGRLAEIAGEFMRKGSRAYIEGSIHTRKWQDKQSGQDRYSTEIKGLVLQMLDNPNQDKPQSQGAQAAQMAPASAPAGGDPYSDDIPFARLTSLHII